MTVCIITYSQRSGRTLITDLFWGVADNEITAKQLVLERIYKDDATLDAIGDEWHFRIEEVETLHSPRHRR